MDRYRFLPSYHYVENEDGVINNPATDKVRTCTIAGNHGRNLIPFPYIGKAGTQNGVTITIDSVGVITLNGTATASVYFGLLTVTQAIKKPGKYTISGAPGIAGVSVQCKVDGAWTGASVDTGNGATFTVTQQIDQITVQINKGTVCDNVVVKPMLEEGESVTPFEPWCGVGDKTRNLIPYPYSDATKTVSGITFTDNEDGSLTLNGTATPKNAYYAIWSRADRVLDKTKTYLMTSETTIPTIDAYMYMDLSKSDGTGVATFQLGGLGYKIVDLSQYDFDIIRINLVANYQKTFDNAVFKPIIIDMDEHNLIPYPYYTNTDGTVSGITRTINADGSVTLNGTATGISYSCYFTKTFRTEKGKRYFLFGLPDKTTTTTYRLVASYRDSNGASVVYYEDTGKGVVFSGYDGDYANVWIYILPYTTGAVFDNITFRPKLIPIDYEPYGYKIPIANDTRENLLNVDDFEATQTNSYYANKTITLTDSNISTYLPYLDEMKGKSVVCSYDTDNENFQQDFVINYNVTTDGTNHYIAFSKSNNFTNILPDATPVQLEFRARSNSADLNGVTVKISNITMKLADVNPEITDIYLPKQIMQGEIETFNEPFKLSKANQLSVETAVKPSAVKYTYYTY